AGLSASYTERPLLSTRLRSGCILFFSNTAATPEIYTLSLHDALPISKNVLRRSGTRTCGSKRTASWPQISGRSVVRAGGVPLKRSEEHTSELQSRFDLVCRLLLEKKKRALSHNYTVPRAMCSTGRCPE